MPSSALVPVLALALLLLAPSNNAHVLLTSPKARVENDYLYSFEAEGPDLCSPWTEPMSCNQFCGHPADDPNSPVTELEVGVPVDIKWLINIPHAPYKFRIALNHLGGGDNHFDNATNLLATGDTADASDSGNQNTGMFTTSVTIPPSFLENCSDPAKPCALHLWDLNYFVSCANVVLVGDNIEMPLQPLDDSNGSSGSGSSSSSGSNGTGNNNITSQYGAISLLDGTGSDSGWCIQLGAGDSVNATSCETIVGAKCSEGATSQQWAYHSMEGILNEHYQGGLFGRRYNNGDCGKEPTPGDVTGQSGPACLHTFNSSTPGNPSFDPGATTVAAACRDYGNKGPSRWFRYTSSGKFKIFKNHYAPFRGGDKSCLGMAEEPNEMGHRTIKLMDCNTTVTDVRLITWKVDPMPSSVEEDGPMPEVENDLIVSVGKAGGGRKLLRGMIGPEGEEETI